MRLTAAVVVAGAALAAAAAAAPAADDPTPTRDCRSRGDPSNGVPMAFVNAGDVVIGPVSLAGARRMASSVRLDRGDDGRFFAKLAAKVLWGRPVTISVAEASRPALALRYTRDLTSAVRFVPCPPGTRMFGDNGRLRRVTAFPGGVSFTRRGCFDLEVRVERGRTYRRTISLGAGACE
jgi:hypothetical protein